MNVQNFIAEFDKLVPSTGTVGAIFAAGAIILAGYAIYTEYKKRKNAKAKLKSELLTNHAVFNELPKYKLLFMTNFVCENKTKEEVLRAILIHKIDSGLTHLHALAEEIESYCDESCPCTSAAKLRNLNETCIHNIVYSYNNFYKDGNYSAEEIDLIQHALDKFNMIHAPAVQMVQEAIEMTNDNFMYTTCAKTIQTMIFNIYLAAFTLSFRDCLKTITEINGYFDGKEFKKRIY